MDQHLEQYARKLNTLVPSIELSNSLFFLFIWMLQKKLIIAMYFKRYVMECIKGVRKYPKDLKNQQIFRRQLIQSIIFFIRLSHLTAIIFDDGNLSNNVILR